MRDEAFVIRREIGLEWRNDWRQKGREHVGSSLLHSPFNLFVAS